MTESHCGISPRFTRDLTEALELLEAHKPLRPHTDGFAYSDPKRMLLSAQRHLD